MIMALWLCSFKNIPHLLEMCPKISVDEMIGYLVLLQDDIGEGAERGKTGRG